MDDKYTYMSARSKTLIVSRTQEELEPKIWKNNKNTEAQPKLSGSYKKSVLQGTKYITSNDSLR